MPSMYNGALSMARFLFLCFLVWFCAGKMLPLFEEARQEHVASTGQVLKNFTDGMERLSNRLNYGESLGRRELATLASYCTASNQVRKSAEESTQRDLLTLIGIACNDWGRAVQAGVGVSATSVIQFSEMISRESRIKRDEALMQLRVSHDQRDVQASEFFHNHVAGSAAWYSRVINLLENIRSI